ncbi:MAG: cupin domain-containing protein [Gammaproteobacteria bacterium]|nr:MAG: cupin domain-containing protein [Gammaproteobacteria bacterium]
MVASNCTVFQNSFLRMKSTTYSAFGWGKETFQPLTINDQTCEFDWVMRPGGSVPEHFHKESDELFKVLEGEVTFRLNGKTIVKKAGEELFVPKMAVHGVANKSKGDCKCRVSYQPAADQGKFFMVMMYLADNGHTGEMAMLKAMHICDRLKYREFSSLQGGVKLMMDGTLGLFRLIAPLTGWDKLTRQYVQEVVKPAAG